jgi:hypothetical protein
MENNFLIGKVLNQPILETFKYKGKTYSQVDILTPTGKKSFAVKKSRAGRLEEGKTIAVVVSGLVTRSIGANCTEDFFLVEWGIVLSGETF